MSLDAKTIKFIVDTLKELKIQGQQTSSQVEEVNFKLQKIMSNTAPKTKAKKGINIKKKTEKKSEEDELKDKVALMLSPAKCYNTMYWFKQHYIYATDEVKKWFTEEDEKKAEENAKTSVKKKPNAKVTKSEIAMSLWKLFPSDKKSNAMKTAYQTWKKAKQAANAEMLKKEVHEGKGKESKGNKKK